MTPPHRMNGALVRVGIDSTKRYGGWNAPVDERTGHFVFVPITDSTYNPTDSYAPGGQRKYDEVLPVLHRFSIEYGEPRHQGFSLPARLHGQSMHLDPDFQELTYGDDAKRGSCFSGASELDFAGFYSSLRSLQTGKLVYGAGRNIFSCWQAPNSRARFPPKNTSSIPTLDGASRKLAISSFGESPENRGLFDRCIELGGKRGKGNNYRVHEHLLAEWGGLGVKHRWIHRSAVLPRFTCGERFLDWLQKQNRRAAAAQYRVP